MSASLRFLADESCDFAIVRALRAEGYDVLAVSEIMPRSDDRSLINQANVERRILLTEDKDFGWLVFVSHEYSAGVLLLRFPGDKRKPMAEAVVRIIREQNEKLLNTFAVVQPGYVRINRKPQDSHE